MHLSPTRDSDGDDGAEGRADAPPRSLTRRQLEELIEDRNARFDALSPAERRMAIARDVLDQLCTGRMQAKRGIYVGEREGGDTDVDADAQVVADDPYLKCTVCAIGSAVTSAVRLFDRAPQKTSLPSLSCTGMRDEYLSRFFSRGQQALMEAAFEMSDICGLAPFMTLGVKKAVEFGLRHKTDAARMRAIWRNVLENGGTFVP